MRSLKIPGYRQTSKKRTLCGDRHRSLSYVAISQGIPRSQAAGRSKEGSFPRGFKESMALQIP